MGSTMMSLAWGGGPGHWGDGAGGWWPVFPILWIALLAGVAVTIAILYARRTRAAGPAAAAEARLAERYARGEIDESEYRERRAVLRNRRR
jgi:putative membrane protein